MNKLEISITGGVASNQENLRLTGISSCTIKDNSGVSVVKLWSHN